MKLHYETWWYHQWIKDLLFSSKNEISGIIIFQEDEKQWKLVLDLENSNATDELHDQYRHFIGIPFHTHPYLCYLKTRTTRGEPSINDIYIFFRQLNKNGQRNHLVFSIEGMYYISFKGKAIPSAIEMENFCKYIQEFSGGWDKTFHCDSIMTTSWCRKFTNYMNKKINGFSLQFIHYFEKNTFIL